MRSLSGDRVTSLSDAELVAMIRRSIEADQQELDALTAELEGDDTPYHRCEAAFQQVDEQFEQLTTALEEAQDEEQKASIQAQIDDLQPIRDLTQERFDLAIERRQLIGQLVPVLRALITQAQRLKDQALGQAELPTEESSEAVAESEQNGSAGETASADGEIESGENGTEQEEPIVASEELDSAEDDVRHWQRTLEAIEEGVQLLEARLATIDQAIRLEQSLVENGRRTVDNIEAQKLLLGERFQELSRAGATPEQRAEIQQQIEQAAERMPRALARSRTAADRVTRLGEIRGLVLEALATRKQDAETARQELSRARAQVARILNPFHPRNLFRWFLDHGPSMLAILIGMVIAYVAVRVVGSRLVYSLACRGIRGSKDERHSRATTLVNSFRQVGSLAVIVGGTLMMLDEAGLPIVPLLGGAAVFGLAVAFGAQNLIQDFFQGFMILLENQYRLNDVVKIGEHAGLVEQITLRTTALRGLDGTLHFIPNGQINAVSNLTHGWSRALLDIPVAYKEDPDRVMEVIVDVCRQVRDDPEFGFLMLEDVTMLGVDDLADSAIVIKFYIKTVPLQQWTIRREILRRLKRRFDAEGIEIPFPHRSLYLRSADGGALEQTLAQRFSGGLPSGN
jgi:small conductance mechanosensitive channel